MKRMMEDVVSSPPFSSSHFKKGKESAGPFNRLPLANTQKGIGRRGPRPSSTPLRGKKERGASTTPLLLLHAQVWKEKGKSPPEEREKNKEDSVACVALSLPIFGISSLAIGLRKEKRERRLPVLLSLGVRKGKKRRAGHIHISPPQGTTPGWEAGCLVEKKREGEGRGGGGAGLVRSEGGEEGLSNAFQQTKEI